MSKYVKTIREGLGGWVGCWGMQVGCRIEKKKEVEREQGAKGRDKRKENSENVPQGMGQG